MHRTTLLTRLPDFDRRVRDVKGLATLVRGAEAAVVRDDAAHPGVLSEHAFLWLIIKPGRRARIWLTSDGPVPTLDEQRIVAAIAALPVPLVDDGPVALVVPMGRHAPVAGAEPEVPPLPLAWDSLVDASGSSIEELVQRLWPD